MKESYDDVLFGVRRSVRYHSRRRGFFERLRNLAQGMNVLSGTAAAATAVAVMGNLLPPWSIAVVGLFVVAFSLADVVVGFSRKATVYTDLMRRFINLEQRMVAEGEGCTDSELAAMISERLSIEADEPDVLHWLNTLCHNELARSMGHGDEETYRVGMVQRWFANWFDFWWNGTPQKLA